MTRLLIALLFLSTSVFAGNPIARSAVIEDPQAITAFVNEWEGGTEVDLPPLFYKAGGIVHLEGIVYKYGGPYNEVMFNLPEGYRPAHDQRFAVTAATLFGTLFVQTNGDVWIVCDTGYWVSLAGVTFRTR